MENLEERPLRIRRPFKLFAWNNPLYRVRKHGTTMIYQATKPRVGGYSGGSHMFQFHHIFLNHFSNTQNLRSSFALRDALRLVLVHLEACDCPHAPGELRSELWLLLPGRLEVGGWEEDLQSSSRMWGWLFSFMFDRLQLASEKVVKLVGFGGGIVIPS